MKKIFIISVLICVTSALYSQTPPVNILADTLPDGIINVTVQPEGGLWSKYTLFPDNSGATFDFTYFTDNTALPETGEDYLISNLYSPDNYGGALPLDACYNSTQNKLYFYGGQNIIVVDALTNNKIKEIEVSETFTYSYASAFKRKESLYLVYNPQYNKVFCATLSADLVVIDCNTDEIVNVISSPEISNFHSTSVVLDMDGEFLYWYVNDTFTYRFMNKVDCQTNNRVLQRGFTAGIFDVVCDHYDSIVYLSTFGGYPSSKIHAISTSNLQTIVQFGKPEMGKMIINEVTNKLYVDDLETSRVLAYDLNSYAQVNAIDVSFNYLSQGACNSSEDLIYFTGKESIGSEGLIIIDGSIGQEVKVYPGEFFTHGLLYDENMDVVFFSCRDKITAIDGTDYNQVYSYTTNEGGKSVRLVSGHGQSIVSANLNEGTATVFELQNTSHGKELFLNALIQLGGSMEVGCYNEMNEKVYYIQHSSSNQQSYLTIVDANNLSTINEIPLGPTIRDIKYNMHNNRVYLTLFDDKTIIPIDGETNQILTNEIINLPYEPIDIFISSGNKIYVSCHSFIYIIDGNTHQTLNTIVAPGWNHFEENPNSQIIYASQSGYSNMTAIDAISNQKIADIALSGSAVRDMCYVESDNTVFVSYLDVNKIDVISGTNLSSTISTLDAIRFLEYSDFEEKIYALSGYSLSVIEGTDVIKTIDMSGYCMGLVYNSINNKVYTHMLYDRNDFYSKIIAIDCATDEISSVVQLPQKQLPGVIIMTLKNDLVFSKNNNRLFNGTRAFSSVCAVKCNTERLPLQNGWNWKSFPRMERVGNDFAATIPVLERVNYFPDLYMKLIDVQDRFLKWEDYNWGGNLNNVRSTNGYKLELDLDENESNMPAIALHGAGLGPATPITLLPNQENWVGYFIGESQMPEDAISEDVFDHITVIKAQYWAMIRQETEPYTWFVKGHVTPIRYGDMVIIEVDSQQTLVWNLPQAPAEEMEALTTEYYSYTEQADYLPIFVETDQASDIQEIAVLAGNEVVGAGVRLAGDTLVEVNAYLEGVPPGTPLEFETWSGYKSQPIPTGDYAVQNRNTGNYEKRVIYKGERAKYHLVSLKAGKDASVSQHVSDAACSPNPFSNETLFTFRLNAEDNVDLAIYDLAGNRIYELLKGALPAGYYEAVWDGKNTAGIHMQNGIYLYKLITGNGNEISGKVVLIK
jgi:hypothetical protein